MTGYQQFPGRYFNGISTRAQIVTVSLQAGKIIIAQPGVFAQPISWEVERLDELVQEKSKLVLKYGGLHDQQVLELSEERFLPALKSLNPRLPKVQKPSSPYAYVLASFLFLLLAFLALVYFFFIPWVLKKATQLFPKETEIEMGKSMLTQFIREESVDAPGTQLVNQFYQKSKISSDYPIHITVVNSPIVNAFALPGGEIVVYRGIIQKMGSHLELVALLGHETGHIQQRHSLKILINQFSLGILLSSIFQDYNNITALLVNKATELHRLSYSREAEEEADRFGFRTMQLTGNDPRGMMELFNHLKQEEKGNPAVPEFMMTHPTTDHRIGIIKKHLKKDTIKYHHRDDLASIFSQLKEGNVPAGKQADW